MVLVDDQGINLLISPEVFDQQLVGIEGIPDLHGGGGIGLKPEAGKIRVVGINDLSEGIQLELGGE